ncbi:HAD family hydrolase [Mucilaginibacter sp.]|uniref:HAD family hydrolase n=1 Tax=Mucilaginibacter sp. TaxID=1882438 RepID=UPI0028490D39|nr:HAD family hydrolase [Mucilaginibacter sp.]MDR3693774.1 HAD family hydrolase [Mucilaginibacter sp.]
MKKALILDLDNTIYPVSSIQGNLFGEIFRLIDDAAHLNGQVKLDAKEELTRRPYHLVANKYNFGDALKAQGNDLLKEITYHLPIQPFDDYAHIRSSPLIKFLVTTGFTKLQWSKVKMLDIEKDFAEIHIVDPELSTQTKKDVFADILKRHHLSTDAVLVIGDDPESEIKAATELGIDTFLFDPENKHPETTATFKSFNLKEVLDVLS